MKTKVTDLTRPQVQENEWPIGTHGYFWDAEENAIMYAVYAGKTESGRHPAKGYSGKSLGLWNHFSPTLPDWAKPKEEKGIEFVSYIDGLGEAQKAEALPKDFQNIEIIVRNYGEYDVFLAYNEKRKECIIYFGHANSGKVL
jgi:hypothetical protein